MHESTNGGGALLGSGGGLMLPTLKAAATPATTYYLQNAPQINQAVKGAVGQYFPGGTPTPTSSWSDFGGRVGGEAFKYILEPPQ